MSKLPAARFSNLNLRNGPRLHCAEWGDPRGRPVLFLHGWPDSWFSFSRVLPLLPSGLRAIAIDQRGFGDSERPDSGYAIAELGADVVAALDVLGIERVMLAGHSFGSFVARQVALEHSRRVAALALIGSGFTAANPVTREVQRALHDLPDPIPFEFAREFQAGTIYRPVPQAFFDGIVAESLKLPPQLWRLALDSLLDYDDAAQLSRIECPTVLLWGDRDALFSRDGGDPASRLGGQPRCQASRGCVGPIRRVVSCRLCWRYSS
jgi:non-heme chloroperoxidase